MKFFKNAILLFSVFLMSAASLIAQDTGGAKGRVCNNRGRGLPSVSVTAIQNGKDIKSATTNNKGEFLVEGLKAGKYDFVFKKDGFNSGTLKNVELADKKVRNLGSGLVLEVDDGNLVIIKGLVFDEEGRSIPNAEVIIERVLSNDGFQKVGAAYSSSGLDAVDRGEFTFRLPEGDKKYRITATFKGKSASKEISVDSAAVYRTAITLNLANNKEN
jgi:hypothetical protein